MLFLYLRQSNKNCFKSYIMAIFSKNLVLETGAGVTGAKFYVIVGKWLQWGKLKH